MRKRFSKIMPYDVDHMMEVYKDLRSGFWFDRDTMRYWSCRVLSDFRRLDDSTALFITSENPDPHGRNRQRRYTVRKASLRVIDDEGRMKMDIYDVGPFCELSKYEAKKLMATYEQD
jgi:hypothetical protein